MKLVYKIGFSSFPLVGFHKSYKTVQCLWLIFLLVLEVAILQNDSSSSMHSLSTKLGFLHSSGPEG